MKIKNKIRKTLEKNISIIYTSINPENNEINVSSNLIDLLIKSHFQAQNQFNNIFYYKLDGGPLHISFCFIQGNSLMAAMAIAAATALAKISKDIGLTISVLGMPYEDYVSKNQYYEKHIFQYIHAAIMVYPSSAELLAPSISASTIFEVHYKGRETHPTSNPQFGINACDAMEISQIAIGKLKQTLHPADKIFSSILKGGDAPNIIPANAIIKYLLRSQTISDVKKLKNKLLPCIQAGAIATGAKIKIFVNKKASYDISYNKIILAIYKKNSKAIRRKFDDDITFRYVFSSIWTAVWLFLLSKMNISHKDLQQFLLKDWSACSKISQIKLNIPFIIPTICITHSLESALFDAALAMAWSAIDLATDKKIRHMLISK